MDILFHTDEMLELRSSHWRLILIIGLAFVIGGGIAFYIFGQKSLLECHRKTNTYPDCTLTQSMAGFTIKERSIEHLVSARVVESRDSDDDLTYRIMLKTESGNVPLTSYSSSGQENKTTIAAQINSYLDDVETVSLKIEQGGRNFIIPLIVIFIGLLEIVVGLIGRYNIWQIDKVNRVITHNRIGLTGRKVTQYELADVTGAIVTSSRDSDGDRTYRVEFTTRRGERIPMSSWYSSGYKKKYQAVETIQEFLEGYS
jgi:hypothetical protein